MLLLDADILPDESRYLMSVVGLNPHDLLLHEVSILHVQEEGSLLRLHLARGDDLGEGVAGQRLL